MKRKKILRIIALVVLLSLMLTTVAFAIPPGQLKKLLRNDHKYNYAADYVKLYGIMKGYGNGFFGFDDYVKRGDIVVMIVRAFKLSMIMEKYEIELDDIFPDVDKESYFAKDICILKKLGVAKGDGKNFNPHKHVTIEEAILLIERSVEKANNNVKVYDVDLRDLYDNNEKLLNEPAKRKDIALMLYYVLTGDEYGDTDKDNDDEDKADLNNIEYTINEDEVQILTTRKFTTVLREKTSIDCQVILTTFYE